MNVVRRHAASTADSPLGLGQFYRAVLSSEFAVYVIHLIPAQG